MLWICPTKDYASPPPPCSALEQGKLPHASSSPRSRTSNKVTTAARHAYFRYSYRQLRARFAPFWTVRTVPILINVPPPQRPTSHAPSQMKFACTWPEGSTAYGRFHARRAAAVITKRPCSWRSRQCATACSVAGIRRVADGE